MFQEPATTTTTTSINDCLVKEKEPDVASLRGASVDSKMMSKYKNYIAASGNNVASIAPIDSNSTEKIDELLEDSTLVTNLSKNSKNTIMELSWGNIVNNHLSVYMH